MPFVFLAACLLIAALLMLAVRRAPKVRQADPASLHGAEAAPG
jgi:hypothetical protein